jgi:hypothetical protein
MLCGLMFSCDQSYAVEFFLSVKLVQKEQFRQQRLRQIVDLIIVPAPALNIFIPPGPATRAAAPKQDKTSIGDDSFASLTQARLPRAKVVFSPLDLVIQ